MGEPLKAPGITKEAVRRILRRYLSAGLAEEALGRMFPRRKAMTMAERARLAAQREDERKAG